MNVTKEDMIAIPAEKHINGIFVTEDAAYEQALRIKFLNATPYNLAIAQINQHDLALRQEALYSPVIEFKVPSIKNGRRRRFYMRKEAAGDYIWSKGYFGCYKDTIMKGDAYNPERGSDYDVRAALIKLEGEK
jgi:hypothetical protein